MGDPKQLPATLFSRAAKEVALERSLFERLAQVGGTTFCSSCTVDVLLCLPALKPE